MPLVSCRACGHQVDTSALACPECGATNPGHKLSRQQRNLIVLLIQSVIVAVLLVWGGLYAWKTAVPMIKETLFRSQIEQGMDVRRQ